MEKKVARIVWNTEGWRKPSGLKGKAGGATYERTVGFGHDEWLLDDQPDADLDTLVATAADHILIQKILPRVEGDEDTFTLTEENHAAITNAKITNKLNCLESECERLHLSASLKKLKEMNSRLQGGFTRFWP